MEEKQNSLGMHSLIYGVYTGIGLILFTLVMYVANLYLNQTIGYLAFVILVAGMLLGSLQYRKNQLKGFMTYGQAFSVNFLIGLFASILSIIFFIFYIKYINTNMIEELLAQVRSKMEAKAGSMSSDDMDRAMGMTEKFMTPVWMAVWGLLGYAFWSAIFALIIGIFIKKKNPEAPTMM